MKIRKFKSSDYKSLCAKPGATTYDLSDQELMLLEKARHSYTIIDDKEEVMAIGGLTEYWPNRAESWIIFDRKMTPGKFLGVHRIIKKFLNLGLVRRVEAAVECDSEKGWALVHSLGFIMEARRLRSYLPSGKDCTLFARVG